MRALAALALLGLVGQMGVAQAASSDAGCKAELSALMNEWREAGYPVPQKPMASAVIGANGHRNSGQEVLYMQSQLRYASVDCDAGNGAAALTRISAVHRLLDLPHAETTGAIASDGR